MGSISRLVCVMAGLAVLVLGSVLRVDAAVTLVSFSVANQADRVVLNWATASEVKTAGFNLYRAASRAGPYSKVNSALIAAKGGTLTGGNYVYTDSGASNRAAYYYRLEEVDLDSTVTTVAVFPEEATPTPTATSPATATPQPTLSPPTATATFRPTSTSTPVPTATPTRVPVAKATPSPMATATPTPVPVAASAPVIVATATATPVPQPIILPAAGATPTLVAAIGPVSTVSASGRGVAGAGDGGASGQSASASSGSQSGTPGPAGAGQVSASQQPTAPAAAATQSLGSLPSSAATSTPAATPASSALALASGPPGISRGGEVTGSSNTPSAQVAEPESPPRGLSLVELGAGGLVGLGIMGILASLVWSLVRYRRT